MPPENKAFGYGIIISLILVIAGTTVIWVATNSILYDHQLMIEVKEQCTNETYLLENQYKPGAAEERIRVYEHSYNLSRQTWIKFIPIGFGVLLLAELIAYVPMSLYAENGKELLQDHNPKKR